MSPKIQPPSLFDACVRRLLLLINTACHDIEFKTPGRSSGERYYAAMQLNACLTSMLPASIFDALGTIRRYKKPPGDPAIFHLAVIHPNMTAFIKGFMDRQIPEYVWVESLNKLRNLVVLDLDTICTDKILEVVGRNCLLLEDLSIISRIDFLNIGSKVTDVGLRCLSTLKKLRILKMDPPTCRSSVIRPSRRADAGTSKVEIFMLICKLPCFEVLNIDDFEVGFMLLDLATKWAPLNIRKVKFNSSTTAAGIKKLGEICPRLQHLAILDMTKVDQDSVINQITESNLKLCEIKLSLNSYTQAMQTFFDSQGSFLTSLSISEMNSALDIDAVILIGMCCPNLFYLSIITKTLYFEIPTNFQLPDMFKELRELSIGNDNFYIKDLLSFFCKCTDRLQKLVLMSSNLNEVDDLMLNLVDRGRLKHICNIWLDCTMQITEDTVIQIIKKCDHLKVFSVNFIVDLTNADLFIFNNNLDIKLGGFDLELLSILG